VSKVQEGSTNLHLIACLLLAARVPVTEGAFQADFQRWQAQKSKDCSALPQASGGSLQLLLQCSSLFNIPSACPHAARLDCIGADV
jgi:hypothetical protein